LRPPRSRIDPVPRLGESRVLGGKGTGPTRRKLKNAADLSSQFRRLSVTTASLGN